MLRHYRSKKRTRRSSRLHWDKLFTLSPARLRSLYARLPDFQQLLWRYDPDGKFRNSFLDLYDLGEE